MPESRISLVSPSFKGMPSINTTVFDCAVSPNPPRSSVSSFPPLKLCLDCMPAILAIASLIVNAPDSSICCFVITVTNEGIFKLFSSYLLAVTTMG